MTNQPGPIESNLNKIATWLNIEFEIWMAQNRGSRQLRLEATELMSQISAFAKKLDDIKAEREANAKAAAE